MSEVRSIWKDLLWATATWLSHFLAVFVIFVTFVICMPCFSAMYDYFEMDLPAITVSLGRFSESMVSYWYLLVVPLLVDFAFLIGASLSGPKLHWLARAWSASLLLGTILLLGITFLATALPFQEYARQHLDPAGAAGEREPQKEI